MKTTGMIFNGEMVRALLDGRKTQTRRPVNEYRYGIDFVGGAGDSVNDPKNWGIEDAETGNWVWLELPDDAEKCHDYKLKRPFGEVGDLIWVRETWGTASRPDPFEGCIDGIEYRADDFNLDKDDLLPVHRVDPPDGIELDGYRSGWHPSIHMPRWASRITLRITDVRVERLHNIGVDDANAEGCSDDIKKSADPDVHPVNTWYASLWDSLYGTWSDNPWVWVYEFEVIHMNVDAVLKQMEAA